MQNILFFAPYFEEKIWGGKKLKEMGFSISSDHVGEAWCVSAVSRKASVIKNGDFSGKTLQELFRSNRTLFYADNAGVATEDFPLLVKIIDANQDLSVQVHPNDCYAQEHGLGAFGKTECWYVLQAPPKARLVYGVHAQNRKDLENKVHQGKWQDLLQKKEIKTGDFVFVPAGKVHALTAGVVVLEIQQSSDTTFRLYDYNRRDEKGNLRDLHINQALDVITLHEDEDTIPVEDKVVGGCSIRTYKMDAPFGVTRIQGRKVKEMAFSKLARYQLFTVVEGSGSVALSSKKYSFQRGDSFMLTADVEAYTLSGDFLLFRSEEAN